MEIDVRNTAQLSVETIRFADDRNHGDGSYCASTLTTSRDYKGRVLISDCGDEFVLVDNAEHARHLINALEKAIDLGWLV